MVTRTCWSALMHVESHGLQSITYYFSKHCLLVLDSARYNPDWVTRGGWFHFDQNGYQKKGRHCVQGLLNYLPSGPIDGGLVVVPKTHLLFDKLFANRTDMCDKYLLVECEPLNNRL